MFKSYFCNKLEFNKNKNFIFMKHLTFENNDNMPAIGLGTWKSSPGEVYKAVRKAVELGYRHFDCAHLYGNEAEIGQALSDVLKNNEVKREDLWITSKLWNNRHRPEQVLPAFNVTLKNLCLDYLDLYLIHWPVAIVDEVDFPSSGAELVSLNDIPLSKTWEGLIGLKENNLSRHIGVSNFSIKKIEGLIAETSVKPEVNQIEMHPFLQQKKLKEYADQNGIFLTGYSPLGSSDRPAIRIQADEPKLFTNETILALSEKNGISAAQMILAWAVNRGTSVVPKSVNPGRLSENLAAANIVLESEDMETMNALDKHYRYIKGDFWCLEGSDYTIANLWDE